MIIDILLNQLDSDHQRISYRKEWNKVTGSVTASILLQQTYYWYKKNGFQPFYKFKQAPAKPHDFYDPDKGDDWCNELGFSRKEFDGAIKKIGFKLTSKNKNEQHGQFIEYWTNANRVTYWKINMVNFLMALFDLYTKKTIENEAEYELEKAKVQKGLYEKYKRDFTKSTKGTLHITDTTTDTTTENIIINKQIEKKEKKKANMEETSSYKPKIEALNEEEATGVSLESKQTTVKGPSSPLPYVLSEIVNDLRGYYADDKMKEHAITLAGRPDLTIEIVSEQIEALITWVGKNQKRLYSWDELNEWFVKKWLRDYRQMIKPSSFDPKDLEGVKSIPDKDVFTINTYCKYMVEFIHAQPQLKKINGIYGHKWKSIVPMLTNQRKREWLQEAVKEVATKKKYVYEYFELTDAIKAAYQDVLEKHNIQKSK